MDTTSPSTPQAVTEPMWREVIAQPRAFVRRRIADPDRAEDLVGDIVLRIHQNLGSVDDQERLAHRVREAARRHALKRPAWGHRKVWAMCRYDGLPVSAATVSGSQTPYNNRHESCHGTVVLTSSAFPVLRTILPRGTA